MFVEGSGLAFNTVPPSDFGVFELLNEAVQAEPAGSTGVELMGQLAAIGIVKGQPFRPMTAPPGPRGCGRGRQHDLACAVLQSRDVGGVRLLRGLGLVQPDVGRRLHFETPPPLVTSDGIRPFAATGVRKLHSRTFFLYGGHRRHAGDVHASDGPGIAVPHVVVDADGELLDGAKDYRLTLPPDIPAARFWSVTAYDNQTRSMLQTPQRFPRAGSQSYPTPAATPDRDGSTTLAFAPRRPADVPEGNWVQTTKGNGWFPILRFYSPLASFFDKSWRPSEIEPV